MQNIILTIAHPTDIIAILKPVSTVKAGILVTLKVSGLIPIPVANSAAIIDATTHGSIAA